jgi:hypothetical protein
MISRMPDDCIVAAAALSLICTSQSVQLSGVVTEQGVFGVVEPLGAGDGA